MFWYHIFYVPFQSWLSIWIIYHRMKILLPVNWIISECPLNAHGMFTEIRISSTVQWPFSGHSVPLNAAEWQAHFSDHSVIFFNFQGKFFFKNHQKRSFKPILLWITTHEIKKLKKIYMLTSRFEPGYFFPEPVRYLCETLLHIFCEFILILICIHFSRLNLEFFWSIMCVHLCITSS